MNGSLRSWRPRPKRPPHVPPIRSTGPSRRLLAMAAVKRALDTLSSSTVAAVPTTATPKRAAVQAEVLRATEELLAEGASWADLGVERIATTAGISRTAFYFYFADKRELL